jgi:hypothetical protein
LQEIIHVALFKQGKSIHINCGLAITLKLAPSVSKHGKLAILID